jgi:hypothetical protein
LAARPSRQAIIPQSSPGKRLTDNSQNLDNANLDNAKLVTVAERPTEVGASIVVAALKDAGIRAVATGGFTAGFRAEAPGWVFVKTLERDAEQAREVISEIKVVSPNELESGE